MSKKKYVSLSTLQLFLDNLKDTFSALSHKHTIANIEDYVVDTELSSTSTNPVQNRVLNEEFETIATAMNLLDSEIDSHTHEEMIRYSKQTLTEEQKLQAQNNIGVGKTIANTLLTMDLIEPLMEDDGEVLVDSSGVLLVTRNEEIFLPKVTDDNNGNVLKVVDGKWVTGDVDIPEMPEINYPVTSVNGMTGDVVIEVGSGSGEHVQPDWNQNDESAADYVKNRTHFVRSEGMSITWDGDTSTIDTFVEVPEMGNLYYVSDQIPSNDCLQNGILKIRVVAGEASFEEEMPLSEMWMDMVDSGLITDSYAFLQYAMVARSDNLELEGITFPRAGTYFIHMEMGEEVAYISELGVPEDVQTLDPKFFPDFTIIGRKGTGENSEIFNYEENTASGDYSHAEGDWTQAYGTASHTEGCETTAVGSASHAEGIGTFAYGQFSHAEGGTNSIADNEVVSGAAGATKYTATDFTAEVGWVLGYNDVYARITNIAQDSETGVYTITLDKTLNQYSELVDVSVMAYPHVASGNYSHAEGSKTTAFGIASHTEGGSTFASGNYSHAEGMYTGADGEASHAEGDFTTAEGKYSHAEGSRTAATGECSHAEGYATLAYGMYSHAEGYMTSASGVYSHAEGTAYAAGTTSHAEGCAKMVKIRGTAESDRYEYVYDYERPYMQNGVWIILPGTNKQVRVVSSDATSFRCNGSLDIEPGEELNVYCSNAAGDGSHAEGTDCVAVGSQSHAEGRGTIATGGDQHVQGRYNVPTYYPHPYAHIVGNGTEQKRSNAHTLDWDGNAWYAGTVEATGIILKSSTEGSTKRFKITIDDDGVLTATEIVESAT